MKSLRLSFGILLVQAFLYKAISAEEEQVPFVGEIGDIQEAVLEEVIPGILPDILSEEPILEPIWSLCGDPSTHLLVAYSLNPLHSLMPSDKDGVSIEPAQPLVGDNITVTVRGQVLKRVTGGNINLDLRLMKFIKLNPSFDLCEQLQGDLFEESDVSCPLEEGPVTLVAKKLIPEEVPKVSVSGDISLTNQDGETLTCISPI